jgi:hypothetical protein
MSDVVIKYTRDIESISEEMIELCNEMSVEDNKTYFIFDKGITDAISYTKMKKDEIRDSKIDKIISDNELYYIDDEIGFKDLPSRFSFYDTVTKSSDRYERYSFVIDFIKSLGFTNSMNNLGLEMEQSYLFVNGRELYRLIIKPNMFIILSKMEDNYNVMYSGFFNKGEILHALLKSNETFWSPLIRDFKLIDILN